MGAAVRARYEGRGRFYWDIWNEPNFEIFWDGTREQFFETFAIAERIMREELGADARIVGPSTSTWRLDWIQGRADFCLQRGCRFDAVSWHDLPDDMPRCPGYRSGWRARASCCRSRATSLSECASSTSTRSWGTGSSSRRAPRSATSPSSRAPELTWRSSRAGRTAGDG
jgi:hypothetical protein